MDFRNVKKHEECIGKAWVEFKVCASRPALHGISFSLLDKRNQLKFTRIHASNIQ